MSGVSQLVTSGPLILALPVAAAAGAVTFLSPCCLPLVPGYLSFVTGMAGAGGSPVTAAPVQATAVPAADGSGIAVAAPPVAAPPRTGATVPPRGRVVAGTALFVLGFSVVFVAYGAALGGLGHLLTGHARLLTRVLGGLTIVLGLLFAGALDRFSFAGRIVRPAVRPRAGLAGAPLLGVMFGLGWTPCIGPTLTAVLALSASTGTVARGGVLAFVYALGLGVPFLLVSFGFQASMRAFAFFRRHARLVTQIGGAMLICVGLLEVTGAWSTFMAWLQVHWVSNYQPPI
ncbi:MAG: cytochrome c biogenesis protein CcdA [Streptosporangiaceae bacterium]